MDNKEKLERLENALLRLQVIHEMRWILLNEIERDHYDIYIEGNEILNEAERKVWDYINGKLDKY